MKAPRRTGRPVDLFVKSTMSYGGSPLLYGTFKTVAAAEKKALEKLGATVAPGKKPSACLVIEALIEDCTTGLVVPGPRFKVNEEWTKILRRGQDGEWKDVAL